MTQIKTVGDLARLPLAHVRAFGFEAVVRVLASHEQQLLQAQEEKARAAPAPAPAAGADHQDVLSRSVLDSISPALDNSL
jgi:hypothetical protein